MTKELTIMDENNIKDKIYTIRDMKVMLDRDLANLYEVKTKVLIQAVKRNIKRFPKDFMFQLTKEEFNNWKSQIVTSNSDKMGLRRAPYVFTEQGVSMLSAILKSKIAIEVSVKIMRAFVSMRKFLSQNALLFDKLNNVDKKLLEHDQNFEKVFNAIEDNILSKEHNIFFDGKMFESYKFVSDLIKSAKKQIILIDNYIDDSVLILFSERKENVKVTIHTKDISKKLKYDLDVFNSEFEPISIEKLKKSHDRFLIIDEDVYHFGASLKDLGKSWFAFSKFEKEAGKIIDELEKL